MERVAWVNGVFGPLQEARVSVLDRGFLFADGVYEVAAVIGGRLVDTAAHLARLQRSAGELGLRLPETLDGIVAIQRALVERNRLDEGLVYLQLTRGAGDDRDFGFSDALTPTLVLFTQAKTIVDAPAARTGIAVRSVPDLRWARRDIKSVALLAQVLAKRAAAEAGCQEAWLVEDGLVTEGASSTAFIVAADGTIITRANAHAILPGCTRAALQALAADQGFVFSERGFSIDEALAAREAFVTSASTLVTAVVTIDGRPVGDGRPGPVAARLRALYLDFARATATA